MDFTYDEEQQALREAVRGLVGKSYSDFENRRRTVADEPGFDEKLWTRLAEMGVLGLPFDEEYGGMGAGPVEVGIVAQELGRVLAPEPFLTSVVLAGGRRRRGRHRRAAGRACSGRSPSGRERARLRARRARHPLDHARPPAVTATGSGDGWTLSGVKEPVPHGARADRLVVSAALPDGGTGLFLVAGDAAGLTRDRLRHLRRRPRRPGRLRRAPRPRRSASRCRRHAQRSPRALDARPDRGLQRGRSARWSSRCDATSEYLKSRKQFGVPLKTFQALTFRAADMYVSLELATSVALWATMVLAAGHARGGRRGRRARRPAGQPGRPAHRPGGDPAARRHRDDRGVQRRQLHQPPHRARPPARRRPATTCPRCPAAIGDHDEVDPLP